MVPGSRCLFIVGFERCMTTSLATYLVDNLQCSLLVEGVKEPNAFLDLSAPTLVKQAVGWPLDASVVYIVKPEALRAIRATVEDYRIIVCMRDQVERTVSAFAYYKSSITHPDDSLNLVFGNAEVRGRLAQDSNAPLHLRQGPIGRYAYTAILTTLAGVSESEANNLIEEFAMQSFAQRVYWESKFFKKQSRFPPLSILLHSQYAYFLRQMLEILDPERIMLVTPNADLPIGRIIGEWLGVPTSDSLLPRTNQSRLVSAEVAKARAFCASILGESFSDQTDEIAILANEFGLRSSLFSADSLYRINRMPESVNQPD